jgi:ketosteroid isomerase-like protein
VTEPSDAGSLVLRYFDALNARDWDSLDAVLGRNVSFTVVPYGMQIRGAIQVVAGSRMQGTELPDFHTDVIDLFAAGSDAVAETITMYTLTAPWNPGIPGIDPIMPAGKCVRRRGCFTFGLRNGRIIAITHYHDRLTAVRQLAGDEIPQ